MTLAEAIDIVEKAYGEKDYDCSDEAWSELEAKLPEHNVFILWEDSLPDDFFDAVKGRRIIIEETNRIELRQSAFSSYTGVVILYKEV